MQEAGFACYTQLEPDYKSMMKTKFTLFVTVLAAALFGMGCASTEPANVETHNLGDLLTRNEDGKYHHKLSNKRSPITCKVVKWIDSELQTEFFLKD